MAARTRVRAGARSRGRRRAGVAGGALWWARVGLLVLAVVAVGAAAWSGAAGSGAGSRSAVAGPAGVAGTASPAGPVRVIAPAGTGMHPTPGHRAAPTANGTGAGVLGRVPGQDPAPPAPGPAPAPPTNPAADPADPGTDPGDTASCGLLHLDACVAGAVDGVMKRAVSQVLNPAMDMLGASLLSTPSLDQWPRIAELWGMSWRLALALYATVILLGGLIVMGHQTVQTRTSAREIGPRLLLGLAAGSVSLPLAGAGIDVANALSRAVLGEGVDPVAGAGGLRELMTRILVGGPSSELGLLLVAQAVAIALLAVLCGWIARVAVLVCLIAAAPLALMFHALPQGDSVARWWWRAMVGLLLMQVAQSLVLVVGLRILLAPGQTATGPFGVQLTPTAGLPSLLVLLVLLWILWRIPGWVWRSWVGGGKFGVVRLLKTAATTALSVALGGGVLRTALTGILGGTKQSGSPSPSGPPPEPDSGSPSGDTRGGNQFALPIRATRIPKENIGSRLKPQSAWIAAHPALRGKIPAGYKGNQFAEYVRGPHPWEKPGFVAKGQYELPLADGWPEQRPADGDGGQFRWPFDVAHVPESRAGARLTPQSAWIAAHPGVRGKIPADYKGNQFTAHMREKHPWERDGFTQQGQYELPLTRGWPPVGADPAQTALPIYPRRIPADQVGDRERVRDLAPRQPWAGGHRPGDGQRPIREIPVRSARIERERAAYRFVRDPGRPHPADLGQIPPDYIAHPLPDTRDSRLRWTPPPPPGAGPGSGSRRRRES